MASVQHHAMEGLLCSEEMAGSPWIVENGGFSRCELVADDHSKDSHELIFTEFPTQDDAAMSCLFEKELNHMPREGYVSSLHLADVCCARSNAVQWMMKVHRIYNFGPLTITLAVNYLDRYLSEHLTSRSWKAWMMQLLCVASLSLAAKMEEHDVPALQDFQVDGVENMFDTRTLQRMELVILSSLGWRMSAVTPFSYVDFLFHKVGINQENQRSLLTRVTELILGALSEPDFLEFRPSVLAISATRCAIEETLPMQAEQIKFNLSNLFPLDKDIMEKCYTLMQELVVDPIIPITSLSNITGRKSPDNPFPVAGSSQVYASLGGLEETLLKWPSLTSQVSSGGTIYISSSFVTSRKRKRSELFR